MKKTFTHNGTVFTITVQLNHKVERRPNGITLHKIIIADSSVTYRREYEVLDSNLKEGIERIITEAKRYFDDKAVKTENEIMLEEMGFTK